MTVDPSAGQLPGLDDLVDLDRLLVVRYDEQPATPVAFGTFEYSCMSLVGSFTKAHVVAISAARCT
jgi:hypothetical protein